MNELSGTPLDRFAGLPGMIKDMLTKAGIEVEVGSAPNGSNSNLMAVQYPPEPPHEDWNLSQDLIDDRAYAFAIHCFGMWALEGLAGRKKIVVTDILEVPEGIDCGAMLGDAATLPVRVIRAYAVNYDRCFWRIDVLVTEFI